MRNCTTSHLSRLSLWAVAYTAILAVGCASPSGYNGASVAVDGTSGIDGGTGNAGADSGVAAPKLGKEVDPKCVDGKYTEVLPTGKESIAKLVADYDPKAYTQFISGVLLLRYPLGDFLVQGAVSSAPKNCIDRFLPASERKSASLVLRSMGVIVHECGHFFDLFKKGKGFNSAHYQFNKTLSFTCKGAGTQGSNRTFARSLIKQDKWGAANKACKTAKELDCDPYMAVYLNGDPTDAKFESGDQGFDMLMEEVTQYINSLAEAVAFRDQIQGFASARDGILVFLWYMERYLQMARLKYPKAYDVILKDACWRNTILTAWGRAWLYLNATEGDPKMSVNGAKVLKNAREPELMAEIARIRAAHGCK